MDNTSLDIGLNDTNSSYDYISNTTSFPPSYGSRSDKITFIQFLETCLVISVSLPLTLGAIYGLCSQVRHGEAAPIYVLNLLISDLAQLCCMIILLAEPKDESILVVSACFYFYCLMVSVCFMVCIALERYLVIVHPLWYNFRRTIKTSVKICVTAWIVPVVFVLSGFMVVFVMLTIFFLLPLPLLLFFTVATLKALSASISVSTDEKCRIAGMLILVLLIYLLLFLPGIIWLVYNQIPDEIPHLDPLSDVAPMFFMLSPLADLVLYIILRKGTIRQLSACVCCCRKQSNETSAVTVSTVTMSTVPSCQLMQRNMERGGERTEEV